MEIYNHGCEHDGLYGFNPQSYDEMLRSGQKLFTVATDDNHNMVPADRSHVRFLRAALFRSKPRN